jgi:methyl-galactoside transport system substrate-binding protein
VDEAKKVGVPVIFFNREPDLAILKDYDKARFIGTTASDAGKMQGDLIKKLWESHPEYDRNHDGKVQYVMFQGPPDNPEAVARTEYSVRRARERGADMQQMGETSLCDWDEGRAKESMRLAFNTYGDKIEMVISNNDAMALGAIAALAEAGYNKEGGDAERFIPVIGVDATPQAVEAITKGVMSATVKQDAETMGQTIARIALNMVRKKDYLQDIGLSWDESGIAIRIPYGEYSGN